MAPDAIESRLSRIQQSMEEFCRLQGVTTATLEGLQRQFDQVMQAHTQCRAECKSHRDSLWEKNDKQDEQLATVREKAAGESGSNGANWKTWTAIAMLALGMVGQYVMKH